MPVRICLVPDCDNAQRCRGLCGNHENAARRAIEEGRVTERELIARGLMAKLRRVGTGSADDPFVTGSKITGDGN